jgi:hypothetical protein
MSRKLDIVQDFLSDNVPDLKICELIEILYSLQLALKHKIEKLKGLELFPDTYEW